MRRYDDGHKNSLGKGFTALRRSAGLNVRLGLWQVHHAAALFPDATLFEQVDAFEAFEDVALGCNGAGGTETTMLGHKMLFGLKGEWRVKQDRREAQAVSDKRKVTELQNLPN